MDDLEVVTGLPSADPQTESLLAAAVLIVIGPHWLKDGQKRLQNPKDVLRIEIRHALGSTAAVIPTLVGGAPMPPAKKLPAAIAGLVQRNGVALNDADWARSMQFLFEKLQRVVQEESQATTASRPAQYS